MDIEQDRPAGSVSNGPSSSGGVPASPLSPPLAATVPSVDVSPTASLHSNQSFRRPATLDEPPIITVVVQKEGNGYGMKVSGDNPVYVQSVRMGGPAERAGLYSGDKIIKF
ncbi:hypothetical protein J437_LFUL001300 [Ladona fulva]|uniref:PDZ domain-containing protein n=1 Tax=Ladona fulva TaxID=123851 RepID=A0A8K0JXT8_LADFU|nr:hypothetical protein J437_LFUL001300 [Ladona fulva]